MSKAKNLVIYREPNTSNLAVDAHGHTWSEDYQHFDNGLGVRAGIYISGPAIDRLYEFEKLGMEPGEIKGRLEAADDYRKEIETLERTVDELRYELAGVNAENRRLKKDASEYLYEVSLSLSARVKELEAANGRLKREKADLQALNQREFNRIHELHMENEELNKKNQRQAENIEELQKENEKLRKDINRRDRAIDGQNAYIRELNEKIKELEKSQTYSWKSIAEGLQVTIDNLREENRKLRVENIDRYQENAELEKKLNRSVESNRALQKQIEFYQDKLDRVVEMVQED